MYNTDTDRIATDRDSTLHITFKSYLNVERIHRLVKLVWLLYAYPKLILYILHTTLPGTKSDHPSEAPR